MSRDGVHGRVTRDALPEGLAALLDGRDPAAKIGETFVISTVSAEGWPHAALLSVGELLAPSPRSLLIALHAGSTTTANLERTQQATLLAVYGAAAHTVRLHAHAVERTVIEGLAIASFAAEVVGTVEHRADYAELESGPRFTLTDRDATVRRWEKTLAHLRALGAADWERVP